MSSDEDDGVSCCTCGDWQHAKYLLICEICVHAFHTFCLNPPVEELPRGKWRCPYCVTREPDYTKQTIDYLDPENETEGKRQEELSLEDELNFSFQEDDSITIRRHKTSRGKASKSKQDLDYYPTLAEAFAEKQELFMPISTFGRQIRRGGTRNPMNKHDMITSSLSYVFEETVCGKMIDLAPVMIRPKTFPLPDDTDEIERISEEIWSSRIVTHIIPIQEEAEMKAFLAKAANVPTLEDLEGATVLQNGISSILGQLGLNGDVLFLTHLTLKKNEESGEWIVLISREDDNFSLERHCIPLQICFFIKKGIAGITATEHYLSLSKDETLMDEDETMQQEDLVDLCVEEIQGSKASIQTVPIKGEEEEELEDIHVMKNEGDLFVLESKEETLLESQEKHVKVEPNLEDTVTGNEDKNNPCSSALTSTHQGTQLTSFPSHSSQENEQYSALPSSHQEFCHVSSSIAVVYDPPALQESSSISKVDVIHSLLPSTFTSEHLGTSLSNTTKFDTPTKAKNPRRLRCGKCPGCLIPEICGECNECLKKVKFGGDGRTRRGCIKRRCHNLKYPTPRTPSTPLRKESLKTKSISPDSNLSKKPRSSEKSLLPSSSTGVNNDLPPANPLPTLDKTSLQNSTFSTSSVIGFNPVPSRFQSNLFSEEPIVAEKQERATSISNHDFLIEQDVFMISGKTTYSDTDKTSSDESTTEFHMNLSDRGLSNLKDQQELSDTLNANFEDESIESKQSEIKTESEEVTEKPMLSSDGIESKSFSVSNEFVDDRNQQTGIVINGIPRNIPPPPPKPNLCHPYIFAPAYYEDKLIPPPPPRPPKHIQILDPPKITPTHVIPENPPQIQQPYFRSLPCEPHPAKSTFPRMSIPAHLPSSSKKRINLSNIRLDLFLPRWFWKSDDITPEIKSLLTSILHNLERRVSCFIEDINREGLRRLPFRLSVTRDAFDFEPLPVVVPLEKSSTSVKERIDWCVRKSEVPEEMLRHSNKLVTHFSDENLLSLGCSTYLDVLDKDTLESVENETLKTFDNSRKNLQLRPDTYQHTFVGRRKDPEKAVVTRTKMFFGARYLWSGNQLSDQGAKRAKGIRIDVARPPSFTTDLILPEIVKCGAIPQDAIINQVALNIYHTGTCGIAPHYDDSARFELPVVSIRVFSDSRLSFGCRGSWGFGNGEFEIPMFRNSILVLHENSYASDIVKHCVRPCDLKGRSGVILFRKIHENLLHEALEIEVEDILNRIETFELEKKDISMSIEDEVRLCLQNILEQVGIAISSD